LRGTSRHGRAPIARVAPLSKQPAHCLLYRLEHMQTNIPPSDVTSAACGRFLLSRGGIQVQPYPSQWARPQPM